MSRDPLQQGELYTLRLVVSYDFYATDEAEAEMRAGDMICGVAEPGLHHRDVKEEQRTLLRSMND